MTKSSYRFNPESLNYDKIKKNFLKVCVKYFSYFIASVVLAIGYYIVLSPIYSSSSERRLKKEIQMLQSTYDTLGMRFNMFEKAFEGIQNRDTSIYRAIFYSNPVSPFGAYKTYTEDDMLDMLSVYNNIELAKDSYRKLGKIEELILANEQKFASIQQILTDSTHITAGVPSIQPVENKILTRVGASVGTKVHPFYKILKFHDGIDFTVPIGSNVFATGNGVVTSVATSAQGKGTVVTIDHGMGYQTSYAHLSKVLVSKGSNVKRGQIIALSGDTGMSIWPHLHYEVWKDGKIQNPVSYFFAELSPEEMKIVINLSSNNGQSLD